MFFACDIIPLFARSDCKINDISADFMTPVKYREMQGKRVNIIDNEILKTRRNFAGENNTWR